MDGSDLEIRLFHKEGGTLLAFLSLVHCLSKQYRQDVVMISMGLIPDDGCRVTFNSLSFSRLWILDFGSIHSRVPMTMESRVNENAKCHSSFHD